MSKSSIQTYLGIIDPLDPDPADLDIRDVAHSLSLQCRYTGHTEQFYSVGQHSIECYRWVLEQGGTPPQQLQALMHDAPETYLGDWASPLKAHPALSTVYREVEANLWRVMAEHWGMAVKLAPIVKEADHKLLVTEHRDLLRHTGSERERLLWLPWLHDTPMQREITPYARPGDAELPFLNIFHRLTQEGP